MTQNIDIVRKLRLKAFHLDKPPMCRAEIEQVWLLRQAAREIEALRAKLKSEEEA